MNVNKFKQLKVIYCRTHHLLIGFDSFLDEHTLKELNYDWVKVAQLEHEKGYLSYLQVQ